jgi:hypothetical protein
MIFLGPLLDIREFRSGKESVSLLNRYFDANSRIGMLQSS